MSMKLFEYIKSLIPVYGRSTVLQRVEDIITKLEDAVIPSYRDAEGTWKNSKFTSKRAMGLVAAYQNVTGNKKSFFTAQLASLENTLAVLKMLHEYSSRIFQESEAVVAVTYGKATAMRAIDAADLHATYSLKLLNFLIALECAELNEGQAEMPPPVEVKWLETTLVDAGTSFMIFAEPAEKIKEKLEALPEAVVSSVSDSGISAVHGLIKLDPMGMARFTGRSSVGHWWSIWKADRDAKRYHEAIAIRDETNLRLMHLRKLQAKSNDPAIERQIASALSLHTKMTSDVRDMEKEYGIA